MGVQQSAVPPCFGALHCAVVQGFGSLSRPGRGGKAGERAFTQEVLRCGLPLTVRSFPKLLRLVPAFIPRLVPPAVRPSPGRGG